LSGEEVDVVEALRARGYRAFYEGAAAVRHSIQRDRLRPGWLLSRLLWQGATDALRDRAGRTATAASSAPRRGCWCRPRSCSGPHSPALLRARCGAPTTSATCAAGGSRGPLTIAPACPPRRPPRAVSRDARQPQSPSARGPGRPPFRCRERLARAPASAQTWSAGSPSPAQPNPGGSGRRWWRGFRAAAFDRRALVHRPDCFPDGDGMEIPDLFPRGGRGRHGRRPAGAARPLGLQSSTDAPWASANGGRSRHGAALFARATDPSQVRARARERAVFPDATTWMPVRETGCSASCARAAPAPHPHVGRAGMGELEVAPPDPAARRPRHGGGGPRLRGGDAGAVEWRFGQVPRWRERHGQTVLVRNWAAP
jgi:hypothetical protein